MTTFEGVEHYLQMMGGLHDALVQKVCWNQVEGTVELHLENLYSNFEGLPADPGQDSVRLCSQA